MDEFTPERFINIQLHTYGPRIILEPLIKRAEEIVAEARQHRPLQEFNYERHILFFSEIRELPSFSDVLTRFDYHINVQSGCAVYHLPYYRAFAFAVMPGGLVEATRDMVLDRLFEEYMAHCKRENSYAGMDTPERSEFETAPLVPSFYMDFSAFWNEFFDKDAVCTRAADKFKHAQELLDLTISCTAEERHEIKLTEELHSSQAATEYEQELVETTYREVLKYLDRHFGKRKIVKADIYSAVKRENTSKAVELVSERFPKVFKLVGECVVCDWIEWKREYAK